MKKYSSQISLNLILFKGRLSLIRIFRWKTFKRARTQKYELESEQKGNQIELFFLEEFLNKFGNELGIYQSGQFNIILEHLDVKQIQIDQPNFQKEGKYYRQTTMKSIQHKMAVFNKKGIERSLIKSTWNDEILPPSKKHFDSCVSTLSNKCSIDNFAILVSFLNQVSIRRWIFSAKVIFITHTSLVLSDASSQLGEYLHHDLQQFERATQSLKPEKSNLQDQQQYLIKSFVDNYFNYILSYAKHIRTIQSPKLVWTEEPTNENELMLEKARIMLSFLNNLTNFFNNVIQHIIIPKHADKFPFIKPVVLLLLEDLYRFHGRLNKACDNVKKLIFKLADQPDLLQKYFSFYSKFLQIVKVIKKLEFIQNLCRPFISRRLNCSIGQIDPEENRIIELFFNEHSKRISKVPIQQINQTFPQNNESMNTEVKPKFLKTEAQSKIEEHIKEQKKEEIVMNLPIPFEKQILKEQQTTDPILYQNQIFKKKSNDFTTVSDDQNNKKINNEIETPNDCLANLIQDRKKCSQIRQKLVDNQFNNDNLRKVLRQKLNASINIVNSNETSNKHYQLNQFKKLTLSFGEDNYQLKKSVQSQQNFRSTFIEQSTNHGENKMKFDKSIQLKVDDYDEEQMKSAKKCQTEHDIDDDFGMNGQSVPQPVQQHIPTRRRFSNPIRNSLLNSHSFDKIIDNLQTTTTIPNDLSTNNSSQLLSRQVKQNNITNAALHLSQLAKLEILTKKPFKQQQQNLLFLSFKDSEFTPEKI